MKLMGQSDKDKLKGEESRSRESLELGELCSIPVDNKQLEATQLKLEISKPRTVSYSICPKFESLWLVLCIICNCILVLEIINLNFCAPSTL